MYESFAGRALSQNPDHHRQRMDTPPAERTSVCEINSPENTTAPGVIIELIQLCERVVCMCGKIFLLLLFSRGG